MQESQRTIPTKWNSINTKIITQYTVKNKNLKLYINGNKFNQGDKRLIHRKLKSITEIRTTQINGKAFHRLKVYGLEDLIFLYSSK